MRKKDGQQHFFEDALEPRAVLTKVRKHENHNIILNKKPSREYAARVKESHPPAKRTIVLEARERNDAGVLLGSGCSSSGGFCSGGCVSVVEGIGFETAETTSLSGLNVGSSILSKNS